MQMVHFCLTIISCFHSKFFFFFFIHKKLLLILPIITCNSPFIHHCHDLMIFGFGSFDWIWFPQFVWQEWYFLQGKLFSCYYQPKRYQHLLLLVFNCSLLSDFAYGLTWCNFELVIMNRGMTAQTTTIFIGNKREDIIIV